MVHLVFVMQKQFTSINMLNFVILISKIYLFEGKSLGVLAVKLVLLGLLQYLFSTD